jgi:DNA-binding transcriptional ArsR family regulator
MAMNESFLSRCTEVSAILKALAHPDRLKLLCLLVEKERTVGEIVEACGSSQSQISQFLSRMKLEGLVASQREGQQVYYRIADPQVRKLIRSLKEIYCR